MNVVCYKRVSTDEQADSGFSLQYQEELLKKWCEVNKHNIVQIFTEDYSGKTFDRPEWNKLMEFLKKNKGKVDLVLCSRWDRFSRNQYESLTVIKELQKLGVTVDTIEQPLDLRNPESKILLNVYLTLPEVENDVRSRNTIKGSYQARVSGCWTGTAPKGYDNYRDGKYSTLKPNDDAPLIVKGFERMASGAYSADEVRRWLNEQGLKMCKQSFYNIIRNIVYIGKVRTGTWNNMPDQIVSGLHPPLVSEEVFYRANDVLDGRKRNMDFDSDKTDLYPLKGFLMCPVHKTSLTAYASTGRKGKKYHYYLCTDCGKEQRHRLIDVHQSIEDILGGIQFSAESLKLYRKTLEKLFDREDINRKHDMEKLQKKIEQEMERKTKLQNGYLDGHITPSDYKEMKENIENNLRSYQERLDGLTNGMTPYKNYITKEVPMLENLVSFYRTADGRTKKKILGCIFSEKLVLEKGRVATTPFSEGVQIMFKIFNALQGSENKKEVISDLLSKSAPLLAGSCKRSFGW